MGQCVLTSGAGLQRRGGRALLTPGSAPDFVVLDDSLHVQATYISGELVWQADGAQP